MHTLEIDQIVSNNNFSKYIKSYSGHVDEILITWNGTRKQLEGFLDHVNNLHLSIKFTLAILNDFGTLNFLDLSITIANDSLVYNIFRKLTHTGIVIKNNCKHSIGHNLAVFHSYLSRLLTIPLNEDNFQEELNIICQITEV